MNGPIRSFWSEQWPRRAARELFREVVEVVDELAVRGSGGARQRLEPRWVATVFGRGAALSRHARRRQLPSLASWIAPMHCATCASTGWSSRAV
jgi:hypothetical protein